MPFLTSASVSTAPTGPQPETITRLSFAMIFGPKLPSRRSEARKAANPSSSPFGNGLTASGQ
jgi:hypothetical protein